VNLSGRQIEELRRAVSAGEPLPEWARPRCPKCGEATRRARPDVWCDEREAMVVTERCGCGVFEAVCPHPSSGRRPERRKL
jgi:MinD superfamily P-loop ATPase